MHHSILLYTLLRHPVRVKRVRSHRLARLDPLGTSRLPSPGHPRVRVAPPFNPVSSNIRGVCADHQFRATTIISPDNRPMRACRGVCTTNYDEAPSRKEDREGTERERERGENTRGSPGGRRVAVNCTLNYRKSESSALLSGTCNRFVHECRVCTRPRARARVYKKFNRK